MSYPTLLAQILAERRWSIEDAARAFRTTAREMGEDVEVTARTMHRWRNGDLRRRPRMACCRVLERMFGDTVERLLALADDARASPTGLLDLPGLLSNATEEATAHLAQVESTTLGPATLEQAGDDVIRLARAYALTPPAQILSEAARLRGRVAALLPRTSRPDQQHDLYLMIGQLCGLLAIAAFDLGDIPAATSQARAAWGYGELTRHNSLRAWARCTQALLAYWEGRPGTAIRLAGSGKTYLKWGTGLVRACNIQARAYAHLGDGQNAQQALRDSAKAAHDDHSRDSLHDDIGGEFAFGPARQARCRATTHLRLREGEAATEAAGRALGLYDTTEEPNLKIVPQAHADLAAARLLGNDLDGAAEHLHAALQVPVQHRITGLIERLRNVSALLAAQPRPLARPLNDLEAPLRDFLRSPARAATTADGRLEPLR